MDRMGRWDAACSASIWSVCGQSDIDLGRVVGLLVLMEGEGVILIGGMGAYIEHGMAVFRD